PRYKLLHANVLSSPDIEKIGRPELIRESSKGVVPEWVRATIAFTPCRWLAAYIVDMAIVSSTEVNVKFMRWLDTLMLGCFSAPKQTSAMALTVSIGKSPAAVSADSITASVPSSTALATSITSARVGSGASI